MRTKRTALASRLARLTLLSAAVACVACSGDTAMPHGGSDAAFPGHRFDHFVLIVLENEDASVVESVPYIDSLSRRGATLQEYFAVAHPSYPNYLALVSGNTFIGHDTAVRHDPVAYSAGDFGDAQLLINAPTIVDRLQAKGLTWDAFAEDYPDSAVAPASCDFRRRSGNYSRKHFPFPSFLEFHTQPSLCAHVRNLKWLNPDSLAAFTFIAPNMIHDGHDAPLDSAITWLRGFLAPILADSATMRSTVIAVTFDESANSIGDRLHGRPNRVFALLIGGPVRPGARSDSVYTHYSMLRTVEANFGLSPSLTPPGTPPIVGIWK
jgi:acid phosphatase